ANITRDITRRKRLERQLLEVSDREQRRIGQDLHDDLCQQLTGIEFMSQSVQRHLADRSVPEAAAAADIAKLVREAISHTRDLAHGLCPVILEPGGLMLALQELADNTEKLFGVCCRFHCECKVLIDDSAIAIHLYRIAQEAISNAIKHGKANDLIISLTNVSQGMTLSIEDNGTGLPRQRRTRPGMGLHIMEYRARMIGGSLTVQSRAGGGTSVVCSLQSAAERVQ
ncbi:MAG TPA: sensor histidine kinase, partial [Candidatus Binatia bacterium]|nr:sensor histidine kinase [Candidatus Binatia bacterium]